MELQRIKILLQKYFEAETTLDEENELINYFGSGEVEDELKAYVPMFTVHEEVLGPENPNLGDDLMNYILESEHKDKLTYRRMWQIVTAVAAVVIMVLLAVNFYGNRNHWKDTYTDPDQAYTEACKTLEFVAGKYNKGLAQLKPIGKIEDATAPFNSGMKALNKGIKKLESIENLNKKL
jgi:hypothetical protein